MNYWTRFVPELVRRAFKGVDVEGRPVSRAERFGIMRLFMLIGILYAIRKTSKELTGTAVDYMGQVFPTPLRMSPIAGMMGACVNIAQGVCDRNDWAFKKGIGELSRTAKIFVPYWLAIDDVFDLINGDKSLVDVAFYTKKEQGTGKKNPLTGKAGGASSGKKKNPLL